MRPHETEDVLAAIGVASDRPAEDYGGDDRKGSSLHQAPCTPLKDASGPETGPIIISIGLGALSSAFSLSDLLSSRGLNDIPIPPSNARHGSPFEWTSRKKAIVLNSPMLAAMLAAYASGAYVMSMQTLMEKWDLTATVFNIGMTVFVAGFGVAPMILAPISEVHGRYWVFIGAGVMFLLGTLGCAVTDSFAGMVVSRFITGCGASVYATLTGGAIADVFHKEDRNTPMALYSLAIMGGAGLGPLISGVIVDRAGWKWVFYHQLILIAVSTLDIIFLLDETRSNVLLRRKCVALNKYFASLQDADPTSSQPREKDEPTAVPASESTPSTGSRVPRIRFTAELEEPKLGISLIWRSFAFPLRLLFTESVVFWFSAWVSFAWAIMYMQFGSIGLVFRDTYNFTSTQVGAVYTAVILGSVLSASVSIFIEPTLQRIWPRRMASPEGRLLSACFESMFLPVGLFWFGWSAHAEAPWIVPTLAIGSCSMGIFSVYLAVLNYLADTYHQYSSSAQAAQSMCRNLLAGIFPLITHLLWGDLSYGVAGSLLGAIGFLLTGVPWLLSLFGQKIRARSPFAGDLKVEESGSEERR